MRIPRPFHLGPIQIGLAAAAALAVALPILLTGGRAAAAPLAPAENCEALTSYFRAQLLLDGFYGGFGHGGVPEIDVAVEDEWEESADSMESSASTSSAAMVEESAFPQSDGGDDSAEAAAAPDDLGARSEGGTNVQVAGVDESDIVKTDGEHLYIARDNRLHVAKIREGGVDFIASLRIGGRHSGTGGPRELLISGETLLAIGSSFDEVAHFGLGSRAPRRADRTWVYEIDISDPASPRIVRSLHSYGTFSTARLVGSSARLVLEAAPQLDYFHSSFFSGAGASESGENWEDWIARVPLSDWLPRFAMIDHRNFSWRTGYTVACERVHLAPDRDGAASGPTPPPAFDLTTLITFDLSGDDGISRWGSTAVATDEDAVYATSNSLYIASSDRLGDTDIHRFDLSDPSKPAYDATAHAGGTLLNQFAMSEYDGHLRVAATVWRTWTPENTLTVFDIGDDLKEVGKVTGLGPTESIFAVRFLGDRGFVVTFRQVDPLYVLDLSDPTAPAVTGELKIPGFSRYLHPLGGGLLLGVGQDADPETGWAEGLQVSLFDVSNPAAPAQIARLPLGRAESAAEFDHRAFTYHDGVAYLPAQASTNRWWVEPDDPEGVLYAVRVGERSLSLAATLPFPSSPLRSIPVAEQLHVLSNADVRTFALDTHAELGATQY